MPLLHFLGTTEGLLVIAPEMNRLAVQLDELPDDGGSGEGFTSTDIIFEVKQRRALFGQSVGFTLAEPVQRGAAPPEGMTIRLAIVVRKPNKDTVWYDNVADFNQAVAAMGSVRRRQGFHFAIETVYPNDVVADDSSQLVFTHLPYER